MIFERREDALTAVKKYNNLQLDNKPMKIELIEARTRCSRRGSDAVQRHKVTNAPHKHSRFLFIVFLGSGCILCSTLRDLFCAFAEQFLLIKITD